MTDPIDKSLLDRLQALRGGTSSSSVKNTPTKISIDPIQRQRTPTREEALAARLKSLRDQDAAPSPSAKPSPTANKPSTIPAQLRESPAPVKSASPEKSGSPDEEEDLDAAFQTDDHILEELLGDVGPDEGFQVEPSDAQVKALLEELTDSIPKDLDDDAKQTGPEEREIDPDDSDDEGMKREVDDVLARFRDELEIEAAHSKDDPSEEDEAQDDDASKPIPSIENDSAFSLPDLPSDLADLPPPERTARATSTDLDDLTARMAALRSSSAPSAPSNADSADMLNLPEVPTGAPSKSKAKGFKRLTSRTNYTDDDVDSWCTVCLEDATLRCLGCDDDVYCARCWREMHIGPQASFDDRSHRAVQFTRDKKQEKRKVAIGAS